MTVPSRCRRVLRSARIVESVRYQPPSHFWLIQGVETAIFLAAAAALIAITVLAVVGRRRPVSVGLTRHVRA